MRYFLLGLVVAFFGTSDWTEGDMPGRIISYPCPGDPTSDLYHVRINGIEVFVSKFFSVHYAHVACSGTVDVVIHASAPINQFSIGPKRRGIEGKIAGGDLLFSVKCEHPQHLIISIENGPKLLLFLDPPEQNAPQLNGQNDVVDARAWLKDSTGRTDQTGAFQNAFDAVNGTGETLYVLPGIYLCKTLAIAGRHNFKLYLAPGALIRTSFQDENATALDITNSQQITVFGRGVLDNQSVESKAYHKESGAGTLFGSGFTIHIFKSSDVLIDGLVARNSRTWSVCGNDCDRLTIRDCKVMAPVECNYVWTDGYDITGGDTVRLEDCFAWTGDDCFASGDYRGQRESAHFTIQGLVGYSVNANGIRLGFNSTPLLKDFAFENCDFLHMKLYGICLNAREHPGSSEGSRPLPKMGKILVEHCGFEFAPDTRGFVAAGVVEEWDASPAWHGVHIDRLELSDLSLDGLTPRHLSRIYGIPDEPIGEIVLNDLRISNQPVSTLGEIHLHVENATKLTLNGSDALTQDAPRDSLLPGWRKIARTDWGMLVLLNYPHSHPQRLSEK